MICPECHQGMVSTLVQRWETPMRGNGTEPLTVPEVYARKIPCPRCNGSGIAYCCDGEDASCDADTLYGDQASTGEVEPLVA